MFSVAAVYIAFRMFSVGSSGSAFNPSKPARLWTDQTGKYTVEATLEDYKNGELSLRKADGKVVNIPLERMSREDQDFVKHSTAGTPKK
jgi:hypothetical protein